MDPSQRLQELFSLYLQRRCEPAEVAELVRLLEQADAAEALTEPMLRLWEEFKNSGEEYPVDWDKMYARIGQVENNPWVLNNSRRGRRMGLRAAVAASVLLVVAAAAYWGMEVGRAGVGRAEVGRAPEAEGHRRSDGEGSRRFEEAKTTVSAKAKRVIHLPDGSTILLNRNSRLDYPSSFGDTTREVVLSGEAYFDITHLSGRPFLVRTGKLTTRVLGTAFNIRAYPGDKAIEVTVTSGKVQVLKENSSVGLLTDNQQMRYDKGSESCLRQKVDVKPLVAWKPEEVSFDDITMEETGRRLEQWFGVSVSFVNPALKDCRVTATFYREDSLEEIMTVICAVNQSRFTIHDKSILVDGKGCN
jgi:transmembrane sensor